MSSFWLVRHGLLKKIGVVDEVARAGGTLALTELSFKFIAPLRVCTYFASSLLYLYLFINSLPLTGRHLKNDRYYYHCKTVNLGSCICIMVQIRPLPVAEQGEQEGTFSSTLYVANFEINFST